MLCVGIDIGTFSIKLAVVEASPRGARLTKFDEYGLNQDPGTDPTVEIIDILRKVTAGFTAENTRFVIALKDRHVSLRNLNFPFKERHKIIKSLPFELEDSLPLDADETVFDARFAFYRGEFTDVLACASPKKSVIKVLDQSRDIGIFPHNITVQSLAYANLYLDWTQPLPDLPALADHSEDDSKNTSIAPRPARVLLDIGHKSCVLVIFTENCLVDARPIDWGVQEIAHSLSVKYNMHYLEALKEVRKKGFILLQGKDATKDQLRLSKAIKDQVDTLAQALQLSLLELKNQHNLDFREVHILGGGSQIKNMGGYLTQKLEIAVNEIDLQELQPKIEINLSPKQRFTALSAICLAVEALRKPKNPPVNLLKDDLAPESQVIKKLIDKWGHTAAVVGTAYLVIWIFVLFRGGIAEDMSEESRQVFKKQAKAVAHLKGSKASPRNVGKFLKEIKKYKNNENLNREIHSLNSSLDILKNISDTILKTKKIDIDIESLKIQNEVVKIKGLVKTSAQIAILKTSLKSLSSNGKLQSNGGAQPGRKFSFQFNVKRKGS